MMAARSESTTRRSRRPRRPGPATTPTVDVTAAVTADIAAEVHAATQGLHTAGLKGAALAATIAWAQAQEDVQHAEALRMLDLHHQRRMALLTRLADVLGEHDHALTGITTDVAAALTPALTPACLVPELAVAGVAACGGAG